MSHLWRDCFGGEKQYQGCSVLCYIIDIRINDIEIISAGQIYVQQFINTNFQLDDLLYGYHCCRVSETVLFFALEIEQSLNFEISSV